LTYGYDTNIRHRLSPAASHSTVYDFAWDLLVTLESMRREDPTRPILFIAHSLGGIVVKELLRRSKGCGEHQIHLENVYNSVIRIVFLGIPHRGADPRGILHHTVQKIAEAMGFGANKQVVETLLLTSERLRELRNEFSPMIREKYWIVYCFQEQYGVPALQGRKASSPLFASRSFG
ncbi:hypothetical protein B0H67DRAFT_487309, partial [Lasiosphaeris hirsuta]